MTHVLDSSFRDPDGFLFREGGRLFRQVNESYRDEFDRLVDSGLLKRLWGEGLLIRHQDSLSDREGAYLVLEPLEVPYVSYPYEWSFSQLKDAALLTLDIQLLALEHEMSLKDASAYNVQFLGAKPVFIDTLSFESYQEGRPWVAYRQFCQHFLGPLALMAKVDVRLAHLLKVYIDGIPLDIVSSLLPRSTWLRYSLLAHVHLHARSQRLHQDSGRDGSAKTTNISKAMMEALIRSLRKTVEKLSVKEYESEWGTYYADTNYSDTAMQAKEAIVARMAAEFLPETDIVHDFGANTGHFSRIIEATGRPVVAHDIDEMAVEFHYRSAKSDGSGVLPLLLNLTNPSPDLGWAQSERMGLQQRVRGRSVVALALIHHLAISNNVPLPRIASFFAGVSRNLIIEFVPKSDSQVRRLLATREDIFDHYTVADFESAFGKYFEILDRSEVEQTDRTIYAMRRRAS